jgi:hypothetical protein
MPLIFSKANGKVESVMREEIQYFIPLYINPAHGKSIFFLFFSSHPPLSPEEDKERKKKRKKRTARE